MSMPSDNMYFTIETCNSYKTYKGFKYHLNFPDEWLLYEKSDTGRECSNCVGINGIEGFATWRGIILGYCANCSFTYERERGIGFNGYGIEWHHSDTHENAVSAFDSYLKNIDLETVGDIVDNPEHTMENRMAELAELAELGYDNDQSPSHSEYQHRAQ